MSLDSELSTGFQVKYLGSVSFVRKKRRPLKGIVSLQRPLLDLYTGARRRGEHHRSVHPLALTQQLEVCDYGLVVAEGTTRGETVVTKVITPLSNVVLWASVRFHARIIKKRVLGAAFVPLACSDGVLDPKSYLCLSSKQRFLVSLTHPSIFACIYRSVQRPTVFECHAFVCATAEDALAVAACARAPPRHHHRIPPSVDSTATDYYSPSENEYRDTEEESNSYASVVEKASLVGRRRFTHHHSRQQKRLLHHQEARALIGKIPPHLKRREPPPPQQKAPLSAYSQATNASVLSSCPTLPQQNGGRPLHEEEEEPETEAEGAPQQQPAAEQDQPRFRNCSTMTETAATDTEVLAETIDLSSESASVASSFKSSSVGGGGWRPVLPVSTPLVKYTYFGYETYARTNVTSHGIQQQQQRRLPRADTTDGTANSSSIMGSSGRHTGGNVIQGNGTGKVTINVPYRPSSRTSSASSIPHGVRSFHKGGHVRNWSSLSHTSSDTSSQQPPPQARSFKVIRWSSDDRLPRRQQQGGFFFSLKRIGMQSLTKAKHKTGKFISSMKTKIMGPKRSSADGSEDSAYDTSEVCLSPSGRQVSRQPAAKNSAARRQQSWSFHDLRTAAVERPTVRRSHNLVHRRKHRRRRKAGCSSSSSDSGVEAAYHSDNSTRKTGSDFGRNSNRKAGSDLGRNNDNSGVTRVKVQHGMGTDTFQRWSHTNLQDELGYIP